MFRALIDAVDDHFLPHLLYALVLWCLKETTVTVLIRTVDTHVDVARPDVGILSKHSHAIVEGLFFAL
mgnify:CR=1 FL=1